MTLTLALTANSHLHPPSDAFHSAARALRLLRTPDTHQLQLVDVPARWCEPLSAHHDLPMLAVDPRRREGEFCGEWDCAVCGSCDD